MPPPEERKHSLDMSAYFRQPLSSSARPMNIDSSAVPPVSLPPKQKKRKKRKRAVVVADGEDSSGTTLSESLDSRVGSEFSSSLFEQIKSRNTTA